MLVRLHCNGTGKTPRHFNRAVTPPLQVNYNLCPHTLTFEDDLSQIHMHMQCFCVCQPCRGFSPLQIALQLTHLHFDVRVQPFTWSCWCIFTFAFTCTDMYIQRIALLIYIYICIYTYRHIHLEDGLADTHLRLHLHVQTCTFKGWPCKYTDADDTNKQVPYPSILHH